MIQRHILNIELFTTPSRRIAADINDNGMIEIGDLMQLRRVILLIDNDFLDPWSGEKNNNSWRFAPPGLSTAGLSPIQVPQNEDFINIDNVNSDMLNLNFIGVKIGDVNCSNMPNMITPVIGDELHSIYYRDIIRFKVDDTILAANEVVSIDFRASDFSDVLGFQFTLAFDNKALNYQGITGAALPQMGSNNLGTRFTDKGLLTFSWNDANTLLQEEEILFTLHFNVFKNSRLSDLININSELIRNEGYRSGLEYNEVVIDWTGSFTNTSEVQTKLQLFPNPFNAATERWLKVPFEQAITIQLFDVYGRLISDFSNVFQSGSTTISLDESNFPVSGLYYVRISSESMNNVLELMKIE